MRSIRGRAVGVAAGCLEALADDGDQAMLVPGLILVRVGGFVEVVLEALLIEQEARSDIHSVKLFGPSFLTVLEHIVNVHCHTVIVRGGIMRDKTAPGYPEGATQMGRLFAKDAFKLLVAGEDVSKEDGLGIQNG